MNRKQKRKIRLEDMVPSGQAMCIKNNTNITYQMIQDCKCYTGNHGKDFCKYVKIK